MLSRKPCHTCTEWCASSGDLIVSVFPSPQRSPSVDLRLYRVRSQIVFEVKPWEAEADLKGLFEKIVKTEIDGLVWGEAYKLVPVAFGVKKLVLSCVVVDSKVRKRVLFKNKNIGDKSNFSQLSTHVD